MLSHIRGLTTSPRARYTLKWEVQIPLQIPLQILMNSGRSFEHHPKPHRLPNKQSSIGAIRTSRRRMSAGLPCWRSRANLGHDIHRIAAAS
jgi:hypothetical protein